jgi:homopolymeric O-antigen transport system ATP-binding protein
MGDIAIQIENLGKAYRIAHRSGARYQTLQEDVMRLVKSPFRREAQQAETFWALRDISAEIKQGEVVGIIGRNGAGKSTLLKILSRITHPTTGYADVYGRVGSLLEVGTGFHPELTGRENIFLSGAVLGMSRREIARKFDEIVDFAEIEQFLDTPAKRYSSGMYMRLAFAVAAHLEPEILLVDEVLAVGDAKFQEKSLGKMGEVAKGGRTVLFVSHSMAAILKLCQRCLLLEKSKLIEDGGPDAVIQRYLNTGRADDAVIRLDPRQSRAYFTRMVLADADGHPSSLFDVRKPFRVYLAFRLEHVILGLEVGIAMFNGRMDRVFYHSHRQNRKPFSLNRDGDYVLSVKIPGMLLPPGQYSITAVLHIPQIELFDVREHILNFEVEETGSGGERFRPGDMGYVLVDLIWTEEGELPQ